VDENINMLKGLCKKVMEKLEECDSNLRATGTMSVLDIDILDKLTHTAKSLKTTIAMMEAEDEGGESRRSYEGGNSGRWYPGYAYDGGASMRRSYDGGGSYEGGSYADGMSNRRGRDSMGRYTSRDGGGYAGHGSVEDIMDDLRDMPEPERKRVKQMLERM
jgi:hypothetical protein